MPHDQPSSWGPLPYDERDLEAILSGKTDGIAIGLLPVARSLAPLLAAPAQAELAGEDAARAAYRAFLVSGHGKHAAPPAQPLASGALASGPLAAGQLAAGTRHRHRGRRRLGSGSGLRLAPGTKPGLASGPRLGKGLLGAAAAVVVVAGVAAALVSGALSGPGASPGNPTAVAASRLTNGGGGVSSQRVEGGGATTPSPGFTATDSAGASAWPDGTPTAMGGGAASASAICRAYFAFSTPHASKSARAAHRRQFLELSGLAGGPGKILGYCQPYIGASFLDQQPAGGQSSGSGANGSGTDSGSGKGGSGQGGSGQGNSGKGGSGKGGSGQNAGSGQGGAGG
jgi:hypothetical protein